MTPRDIDSAIQHRYIAASETVEFALSRWWGAAAYAALLLLTIWLSWEINDRFTWLTTAMLVVLLINNQRRASIAEHIKLDTIDEVEEHNELEKRDELEMKP